MKKFPILSKIKSLNDSIENLGSNFQQMQIPANSSITHYAPTGSLFYVYRQSANVAGLCCVDAVGSIIVLSGSSSGFTATYSNEYVTIANNTGLSMNATFIVPLLFP